MDQLLAQLAVPVGGGADPWAATKRRCTNAVVLLEMEIPRAFGQAEVGNGVATGFIVDRNMGIILTNKHVVGEGPIRAKATFPNGQKIDLDPVYRDPIHDYGFFRYDPDKIQNFMVEEIKLDPDGAKPETKTLVMGNTGQRGLTYYESVIAKIDADYFDGVELNTFYIMATDNGVQGNSGGPLLNIKGDAIGIMHAGIAQRNLSFYLPLHGIARALKLYQKGEPILRGTIEVALRYRGFQDMEERGVDRSLIMEHRKANPKTNGMLVVGKTLPKGPAKMGGIENGDVIYKINGKFVSDYRTLENLFNSSISKSLKFELIRGGKMVNADVTVRDLAEKELNEMIECSDGIFTGLEYLIAIAFSLPMEGVVVRQAGYMFAPIGSAKVIVALGDHQITDLASFEKALSSLKNGTVVGCEFFSISDPGKSHVQSLTVDLRWSEFRHGKRLENGSWEYRDCKIRDVISDEITLPKVSPEMAKSKVVDEKVLGNAIVVVDFNSPLPLRGGQSKSVGIGVVVDSEVGLVVCSTDTVVSTFGDVYLHFGTVLKLKANVVFVHPREDFTVLQYDPQAVEKDAVAEVFAMNISHERVKVGEKLKFVGATGIMDLIMGEGVVTKLAVDMKVDGPKGVLGVYYDKEDQGIRGFSLGEVSIPSYSIFPHVERIEKALRNGEPLPTEISTLGISIETELVSTARDVLNLPDKWVLKLKETMDSNRLTLLKVDRRMVKSDAYDKLQSNDVILAIDGSPVCQYLNYMSLIDGKDKVKITVLRRKSIIDVEDVEMSKLSTIGVERIIFFAGMILQQPNPEMYFLTKPEHIDGKDSGVMVTALYSGSPAIQGEVQRETSSKIGQLIYKVDGVVINDGLEQILDIFRQVKDKSYVQFSTVNVANGVTAEHRVRLDLEYWPTRDYERKQPDGWNYEIVEHDA